MASGLISVWKCSGESLPANNGNIVKTVIQGTKMIVAMCESEFVQVHCSVGAALKRILAVTLDNSTVTAHIQRENAVVVVTSQKDASSLVSSLVKVVESLLHLKLQLSWQFTLDVVRNTFDSFRSFGAPSNPRISAVLSSLVVRLADINQALESLTIQLPGDIVLALENALGSALRCFGVEQFLKLVPLVSSSSSPEQVREWVVKLLQKFTKQMPCLLSDFALRILPVAGQCKKQILKLEQQPQSSKVASQIEALHDRINQLWSLLPSFCTYCTPPDLQSSFPKLATIFVGVFNDDKFQSLVPHILTTLASLATLAGDQISSGMSALSLSSSPQSAILQQHANTFLPLMMKYIEGIDIGDWRFKISLNCFSLWIDLSSPSLRVNIAKKLLQLILTSTADPSTSGKAAATWLTLLVAFIPRMTEDMVVFVYKAVRPLLLMNVRLFSHHLR